MSHAKHIREQRKRTEQQVQKLLGITPEKYNEYQHRAGLEYLEKVIGLSPDGIEKVAASSTYWSWWINAWFLREQRRPQFLITFTDWQRLHQFQNMKAKPDAIINPLIHNKNEFKKSTNSAAA